MKSFTEGSYKNNGEQDIVVSKTPIPDYRDDYWEETTVDTFGNSKKRLYNNRNITPLTAFQDRVEEFLLMPKTSEETIHEIFMTYTATTVWFRLSVAFYDIKPVFGLVPMVILAVFMSVIASQIVRNPSLLSLGAWRITFILLGVLL